MFKHLNKIKKDLLQYSNTETKENYERYFKGVVKFYGIKGPILKQIFKENYHNIKNLTINDQKQLAFVLLGSKFQEEKSIGIMILNKIHKNLDQVFLKELKIIIEQNVYDWGTCDSLSGKVICRMIKNNLDYAQIVKKWKKSKYMRLQRVSCISFVNIARFGEYNDTIMDICTTTIQNPERFVQLATGWVLRELSLADLELVVNFIKKNYASFSREGLRYAIEKMENPLRKDLLDYGKLRIKN